MSYLDCVLPYCFKMCNVAFVLLCAASDWTMYPFATQNRQDFENLMSVYLDATFRPLLRENDFR